MKRRTQHKKEFKKALSFYRLYYDIKPPYKVIMEASFLTACAENDLNPRDEVLTLLNEKMTPVVTRPILNELRQEHQWTAYRHAKTFFLVKSKAEQEAMKLTDHANVVVVDDPQHSGKAWNSHSPHVLPPGPESVKELVGRDNPDHYFVATNDLPLRRDLGNVSGVPLIYVDDDSKRVMLSKVGRLSQRLASGADLAKLTNQLDLSEADKAFIKSMHPEGVTETAQPALRKKKKRKGTNPLAAKKKKKKLTASLRGPGKKQGS